MGDPTQQVHDFEPGIKPSVLFWTVPVPAGAIDVAPGGGAARLHLEDVAVPDYFNFFNAISEDPDTAPARVSFDVRWHGGGDHQKIWDDVFGFTGNFVAGPATIAFSASDDGSGVTYRSDAANQDTRSAGVGHERNGVFFS